MWGLVHQHHTNIIVIAARVMIWLCCPVTGSQLQTASETYHAFFAACGYEVEGLLIIEGPQVILAAGDSPLATISNSG